MKRQTTPHLELLAAVTGANLARFIRKILAISDSAILIWSDSQITLHWINGGGNVKKDAHIQKKLKVIHDSSIPDSAWKYVPTSDNPADLLTRRLSANAFLSSHQWIHGPDWLPHHADRPEWAARKPDTTADAHVIEVEE